MNPRPPAVSIGLPVRNGENYIERCLRSLLEQEFEDLEIVVSDNASTDSTEAICLEMARRDPRIRYSRNAENVGAAGNYNRVFKLARGKYFKWAAHDDECHPSMIRRCVEFLDGTPERVTMVYPLAELIDEQGHVLERVLDRIESRDPRPHRRLGYLLWALNMCDPVFGLYRTAYLKRTRLIGPFCGADYVLLGELAMMGEIWELNEVLFRLRAHARRSMQSNASARARTAWYDPKAAMQRFILPDWERMVLELMRSARRAPLPAVERWRCCATVPTVHYWRRFKNAGGLAKRRLKAALGWNPVPSKAGTVQPHS